MKILVWKELRENVRLLPIGLFVVAITCWMTLPGRNSTQVLIASDLVFNLAMIAPLLAFALGVIQAFRDLQPASRAYLNHRGVTDSQVFLAKTFAAFVIYLIAIGVPLLLSAAWIAMRGLEYYPMRPAQVLPPLVFAIAAFSLHPASMMVMSRDGSWWGTRLFPLVVAGGMTMLFFLFLRDGGMFGVGIGMAIVPFALAWLVATAREAWIDLASDPASSAYNTPQRSRWLLPIYLVFCCLIVVCTAIGFAISAIETARRSTVYESVPYHQVSIDIETGKPWLVTEKSGYDPKTNDYETSQIGGDVIEDGKEVDPREEIDSSQQFRSLNYLYDLRTFPNGGDGFFSRLATTYGSSGLLFSYDVRGYLLAYDHWPRRQWRYTFFADKVQRSGGFSGTRFTVSPGGFRSSFGLFANAGYDTPLVDHRGVYVLKMDSLEITPIVDEPVEAVTMVQLDEDQAPRMVLRSGNKLMEYRLLDQAGSDDWFRPLPEGVYTRTVPLPDKIRFTAELSREFELPAPLQAFDTLLVGATAQGFVLVENRNAKRVFEIDKDGSAEMVQYSVNPAAKDGLQKDELTPEFIPAAFIPGGLVIGGLATAFVINVVDGNPIAVIDAIRQNPVSTTSFIVLFLVGLVFCYAFAFWAAKQRGLHAKSRRRWLVSVPILGLAAPLSILAIYRRIYQEPCPNCDAMRRVDEDVCPNCGKPWDPPANDGIEIFDEAVTMASPCDAI
ncbi:hypothetical protein [Novipirellula artificiosorum]|uniref:ABC-2 family transporter protein n=1 Tax=Novipirellula artificiosorum TaxID=2528016 RepID=A0A5C6D4Z2_9BACT|nr:hypothetical protein [Novipirellula artificiosorum]TWU32002.1 hypothetical protein Poly41_58900 [Novipirellula artificiosorum]